MAEHHEPGGTVGGALIQEKLDMVTEYLSDSWGIDIQALHEEVQERQSHILEMDLDNIKMIKTE